MGLEQRPVESRQLQEEARHYLAARRELGGDLDEQLVASFVEQVRAAISDEVSRQVRQREMDTEKLWSKRQELVAVTLGTAIPLMIVAAIAGQLAGVIAVCVTIVVVNLILFGTSRR